jgi:2-succinyl-6-hydroxy-2,4-cyclohexadiene-1-carboxylate synthase
VEERRANTVAGLAASLRLMGTGTQQPLWTRLRELTMPALLVVGEHDEKFTALAHRMAAAWGAGAAKVAVIEGAGHAAHLERPDAFLDTVTPFLDDGDHRNASPTDSSNP